MLVSLTPAWAVEFQNSKKEREEVEEGEGEETDGCLQGAIWYESQGVCRGDILSPTLYKRTFFQILSPNTFDFLLTQGL